jgi:hypothetical protein
MPDKAVAKLACGFTINIGNYESARIDVGVEIQGDRSEMSELWQRAESEVTEQLDKQIKIFKSQLNDRRTLLGMEKGATFNK